MMGDWALNRGTNSRHPFDLLPYIFAPCDPVTLTCDLILIGGRGLVMDYPYGKFGDCSFSRFNFIVLTKRTTDTSAKRFTRATVVGVRN